MWTIVPYEISINNLKSQYIKYHIELHILEYKIK